jgi:hypothetical protein
MKLYEALATGRLIKRPEDAHFLGGCQRLYSALDVTRDDWEVAPEPPKACPFCGTGTARFLELGLGGGWVYCTCRASGPAGANEAEAISLWNRRAK